MGIMASNSKPGHFFTQTLHLIPFNPCESKLTPNTLKTRIKCLFKWQFAAFSLYGHMKGPKGRNSTLSFLTSVFRGPLFPSEKGVSADFTSFLFTVRYPYNMATYMFSLTASVPPGFDIARLRLWNYPFPCLGSGSQTYTADSSSRWKRFYSDSVKCV